MTSILLKMDQMTDEQFFKVCQLNPEYQLERTAEGELIIMPPTGSQSGNRNAKLTQQLGNWSDTNNTGINFDSSTGFKLPNGSIRSPDAAWIALERWNQLSKEEKSHFAPICPDFVVEIASLSDSIESLKAKMQEYIDNGTSLGWLIDRQNRLVYVYHKNSNSSKCLNNPANVKGETVLPLFNLIMEKIW